MLLTTPIQRYAGLPFLGTLTDGIPHPLSNQTPTYTWTLHKSVTELCADFSAVLQRAHSGDGCLSTPILCKYEFLMGNLFVLS